MDQCYVTLDPKLASREPHNFLGRLVADVYMPDREYEPDNPSEAISNLWEVIAADQQPVTLADGQTHPIWAVFADFLRSSGHSYTKKDLKAITLKDHHEAFRIILQRKETRDKVGGLLEKNKNKLSMIVGLLVTIGERTGQGHHNYTIHAIAYRVVRKSAGASYDNGTSWINFAGNQPGGGSKRFDWQNVAMGENGELEMPIEIEYEEETGTETDDKEEMKSTTQEENVIVLTDELPGV